MVTLPEATSTKKDSIHIDRRRAVVQQPRFRLRQKITFITLALSIAAILGIFIVGYIIAFVLPPRELVVRVNDVEYHRGDLVELVRINQKTAEFFGGTFDASSSVFESLQMIVENEIILQSAPSHGITVSEAEGDAQIDSVMRPSSNFESGKSDEQIARETRERYSSYLNTIQIDESTHRDIVRRTMARERFRQYIGDSVPFVAEQVRVHRLIMPALGEIDIMKVKFEDATRDAKTPQDLAVAYSKVVREFSSDTPATLRRGGDLGWIAEGVIPEYERDFFYLEPGEISEPVKNKENANQAIFFMISERHMAQELSAGVRDELKTRALQEWVNKERKNYEVYAVFNSDIYSWIFKQLRLSSTAPTPTPDPFQSMLNPQ